MQDEDGVAVTPGIPEALQQQWSHEPAFKKFHEDLIDAFGTLEQAAASPPNKRAAAASGDERSASRRRVVGPDGICKLEDLKGEEIHKVGLEFDHFVLTLTALT